jgi:hypothetical protein
MRSFGFASKSALYRVLLWESVCFLSVLRIRIQDPGFCDILIHFLG